MQPQIGFRIIGSLSPIPKAAPWPNSTHGHQYWNDSAAVCQHLGMNHKEQQRGECPYSHAAHAHIAEAIVKLELKLLPRSDEPRNPSETTLQSCRNLLRRGPAICCSK